MPNRSLLECIGLFGICTPCPDLSDGVLNTPNEDCMQKLCPQEVYISTTPIRAHKPFGVSSFGVKVLDVYGFIIYELC
jgi:hypothetical protein